MPICLDSLKQAAQSLTKNQRANVEIIICDNHSNDGTFELANEFQCGCQVRVLRPPNHFENRTANWHHGLMHAQGRWMMMLHCDDRMAPEGLSNILSACISVRNRNIVLISGRHRTFGDGAAPGPLYPKWRFPSLISGESIRKQILCRYCPFVPFQVMLRETYEQIGGLDCRYELVQDWDLWIRLLAKGEVYYSGSHFGDWRVHEISGSYARTFAREHLELVSGIKRLIPNLSERVAKSALNEQIPRVMKWVPELPIKELILGLPNQERILECCRPNYNSLTGILWRKHVVIALKLSLLRLIGSLRTSLFKINE